MLLYANPYDTSATGFQFDSFDDFEKKFKDRLPVEEYEFDFLDGTDEESALFREARPAQPTLELWFTVMDEIEDWQMPGLYYQLEHTGGDLSAAVAQMEDVPISEGNEQEATESMVDDIGGPMELGKKTVNMYFDYEAYARDRGFNGEIHEFDFAGKTYTAEG